MANGSTSVLPFCFSSAAPTHCPVNGTAQLLDYKQNRLKEKLFHNYRRKLVQIPAERRSHSEMSGVPIPT